MSKSVHYRLPDQLLEDARELAKKEGVTVTDLIIQGLRLVIEGEKPEGKDKPGPEIVAPVPSGEVKKSRKEPETVKVPIIKTIQDVSKVLEQAVNRPEYARPAHHPTCTCGMCKP